MADQFENQQDKTRMLRKQRYWVRADVAKPWLPWGLLQMLWLALLLLFGALLMADANIQFQTGSAVIEQGNEPLLKQLTQIASACPGQLSVEGHTDNRRIAVTLTP